jgi:hypothetical protein
MCTYTNTARLRKCAMCGVKKVKREDSGATGGSAAAVEAE